MRGIRVALSILVITLCAGAQTTHLPERYSRVKAENGLIIGWHVKSEDPQATQISVYDRDGKVLAGLNPLRLVREAKRASILDVSAHPRGVIAVSVVYRKDDASVPAAALLWFDFAGNPLTALALAPSREAWRVTVDSDLNVWTLTAGAGDSKPSEAPMVVGYTASGSVLKEVFKRSEFPLHAIETQENSTFGAPGFGHTSHAVWFWLPGSTDQVTFNADGSGVHRSTTSLPYQSKHATAQRVALTDDGTLLAQVWTEEDAQRTPQASFFFRSESTKAWSPFSPPCSNCTLIGADSGNAFFIKWEKNGSDIYTAPLPK